MDQLRSELRALKNDHKQDSKHCRHCVLRHKKSKKITNIFIGDLHSVTNDLKKTDFADLYALDVCSGVDHKNTGFSFTIQKMCQGRASKHGDVTCKILFLGVTEDIGVFKHNTIIHLAPRFPDRPVEEYLQTRDSNGDANGTENLLEIYPSLLADEDFVEHLEGKFWKYFRNHEKKYLFNPQDDQAVSSALSKEVSTISRFRKARAYILMIHKQNILKDLLKDFESGKFTREKGLNRLLVRIREISLNIAATKDLAGILNVISFKPVFLRSQMFLR